MGDRGTNFNNAIAAYQHLTGTDEDAMVHIEDVGCVEHDIVAGGSGAGSGRSLSLDCMYSGESQDEDEGGGTGARGSEHGPDTSTPGRQPR
jgi:hypothetical protein